MKKLKYLSLIFIIGFAVIFSCRDEISEGEDLDLVRDLAQGLENLLN